MTESTPKSNGIVDVANNTLSDSKDHDKWHKTPPTEQLKQYKITLEQTTGKKYKYRTPHKELPSIRDMLANGPPEKQNDKKEWHEQSWSERLSGPVLLALVFGISLFLFHHTVLTRPRHRKAYTLPTHNKPYHYHNQATLEDMSTTKSTTSTTTITEQSFDNSKQFVPKKEEL